MMDNSKQLEKPPIQEGNKLIAEFMNLKFAQYENEKEPYLVYGDMDGFRFGVGINELKYHKSWDWLMPVVMKCFRIWSHKYEEAYNFDIEYLMGRNFSHNLKFGNISSVYKKCIKFIKWYNNNTK